MASVWIGTSGYSYKHWANGVFYPDGLNSRKWLEFYAERFSTVELNVTFYRLPKPEIFAGWRRRTPEDFAFAVKGSRIVTHIKKLADCQEEVKRFFQHASELGPKLHVVLWQLPPSLRADAARLAGFCDLLRETAPNVRHAFEFRHRSWFVKDVFDAIAAHGMAVCAADWPIEVALTESGGEEAEGAPAAPNSADFIYVRRHGPAGRYRGCYPEEMLRDDARRIQARIQAGYDAYVYFNNDLKGYAVRNAEALSEFLGSAESR